MWAIAGYLVVVPDFFNRDDVSKGPNIQEWRKRHPFESKWAGIDAVLAELRDKYHAPAIGVEGFCWGGHYAVQLAGSLCSAPQAHAENGEQVPSTKLQTPAKLNKLKHDNHHARPAC